MLMRAGAELARAHDLPGAALLRERRRAAQPRGVVWGREALGLPFHDNWWQTETGGIMIANFAAQRRSGPARWAVRCPGVEAAIVRRRDDGGVDEVAEPDVEGELALRPGWPSMFRGYLGDPERYAHCFADGWYLTGDLARRDARRLLTGSSPAATT